MRCVPLLVAVVLSPLSAQGTNEVSQFLPAEYKNIVRIDLAEMRETGIWDELEAGALKILIGELEQSLGISIDSLDRVTLVPIMPSPSAEDESPKQLQVVVFEGNTELDVPNEVLNDSRYADETIGQHSVKRRNAGRDEVFFQPAPKLQIQGSTELLRPAIEGKTGPGMPCPDIMSLMSGRSDGLLFHVVMNVADRRLNAGALEQIFGGVEWPEDDLPQYVMMRFAAAGDPDDPHVVFEAVFRHSKDGEGLVVTERAVDGLMQKGLETPQLRLLAPILRSVERERDRSDLSLRWDLGRARTAAGNLAMLVPLFLFSAAEAAPAKAVKVEAVPVESKKDAGKKKAP